MRNLRYICAQPRTLYYAWQVEVMINNFIKHGINPNNIDIIVALNDTDQIDPNPNPTVNDPRAIEAWNTLATTYNSVRFFFYQDTREQPYHYISGVRPNVLKQHFKAHPELREEAIFYHDCDVLFSKPPEFHKFLSDNIWYLSDTNSYINAEYIQSKGHDIYNKMCNIVGINKLIPKLMNSNSGGAQYLMKNVDDLFWEKVELDSENLFVEITKMNIKKQEKNPEYHELQIWCADMWAVLWNGWLRGNETKVVPEMDFTWATDDFEYFEKNTIYHNAGVTCSCGRQFFKGKYMAAFPYDINQSNFSEQKAGFKYVLEILETALKSPLI